IPLVVDQRGLDLDLEEMRMAGSESLHLATGAAVHADDLPHAETGARHLRLAARGLIGEVNAWTLTHAHGLLQQILGDFRKRAAGPFRDPLDFGSEVRLEAQSSRRCRHCSLVCSTVTQGSRTEPLMRITDCHCASCGE